MQGHCATFAVASHANQHHNLQEFKMRPLRVLTALVSFLFVTSAVGMEADGSRPLEGVVMPGVYLQELDEAASFATFDRVVPLVFEFKTPAALSATAMGLGSILPRLACRGDNQTWPHKSTADWLFTCPIFFHLNTLLEQLRTNWTVPPFAQAASSSAPSYRSASTFAAGSSATVALDDECRSQLRNWRGIDTRSDVGLAAYKTIIDKCALEGLFEEGIQDFNTDLSLQFDKMRANLALHFGNNGSLWPPPSTSDGADLIGVLLGLQALMTTQMAVELQRWRDAATSCQNSVIPISVLQPARLERALLELRLRLQAKKYALLFSGSSGNSRLYKLKLVDCVFGATSLFVQVLVPVVRESAVYRALQVHQPTFLYGGSVVCYVNSNFEAKGARFQSRSFVFEKSSRLLVETTCSRGGLCRFLDRASRPTTDGCLLAVLLGNMDSIRAFCHLECDAVVSPAQLTPVPRGRPQQRLMDTAASALASNSFPLVQRIDSDKFVVTSNALSTLLVKCEPLGRLDELVPPQKFGAVEVVLPCGCYLMFHVEKFYALEPCSSLLSTTALMHHVIPVHMLNSSIETAGLNSQQIMGSPAAVSGPNLRYDMNSRLRYLQPRNRITFPNLTLLVNMTFREEDLVKVEHSDSDSGQEPTEPPDDDSADGVAGRNESQTSPASDSAPSPGHSFGESPEHAHSVLWTLVGVQAFAIGLLTTFVLYKFHVLDRRVEGCAYRLGGQSNGGAVGAISFSANHPSQVTLTDKF